MKKDRILAYSKAKPLANADLKNIGGGSNDGYTYGFSNYFTNSSSSWDNDIEPDL